MQLYTFSLQMCRFAAVKKSVRSELSYFLPKVFKKMSKLAGPLKIERREEKTVAGSVSQC